MVVHIPDPPREETSVSNSVHVNEVNVEIDSDDDDGPGHDGYAMLPTDFNDTSDIQEQDITPDTDSENEDPLPASPIEASTFEKATTQEIKVLWNTPVSAKEELSSEIKEEVLNAMKGFTLPSSAIPAWANEIGEDDWKTHLLDKIRNKK